MVSFWSFFRSKMVFKSLLGLFYTWEPCYYYFTFFLFYQSLCFSDTTLVPCKVWGTRKMGWPDPNLAKNLKKAYMVNCSA